MKKITFGSLSIKMVTAIVVIVCMGIGFPSCSGNDSDGEENGGSVGFSEPCLAWGCSKENVNSFMKGWPQTLSVISSTGAGDAITYNGNPEIVYVFWPENGGIGGEKGLKSVSMVYVNVSKKDFDEIKAAVEKKYNVKFLYNAVENGIWEAMTFLNGYKTDMVLGYSNLLGTGAVTINFFALNTEPLVDDLYYPKFDITEKGWSMSPDDVKKLYSVNGPAYVFDTESSINGNTYLSFKSKSIIKNVSGKITYVFSSDAKTLHRITFEGEADHDITDGAMAKFATTLGRDYGFSVSVGKSSSTQGAYYTGLIEGKNTNIFFTVEGMIKLIPNMYRYSVSRHDK